MFDLATCDYQSGANGDTANVAVSVTATITTGTPTVITRDTEEPATVHERRPSWRLRVDNGSKVSAVIQVIIQVTCSFQVVLNELILLVMDLTLTIINYICFLCRCHPS